MATGHVGSQNACLASDGFSGPQDGCRGCAAANLCWNNEGSATLQESRALSPQRTVSPMRRAASAKRLLILQLQRGVLACGAKESHPPAAQDPPRQQGPEEGQICSVLAASPLTLPPRIKER